MLSDPNYQDARCYWCHEGGELIDCRYTDDCDHRVCADCVKRCPICNMEVCEECQKRTFTNGICDACYESMPEDLVLTPADVLAAKEMLSK